MPTTYTTTIKSAGGDYATVALFESGQNVGDFTIVWGAVVSGGAGTFTAGETINFVGSGATGTFRFLTSGVLRFDKTAGTPVAGDVATGVTSLATRTVDSISYTDGEVRVGEIYDVNPTTVLTIDGATTDATRYLELTVNSAYRHAGLWSTGKQNWQVSDTSTILFLQDSFVRVSYFQIKNTHATAGGGCIALNATGCRVEQCILWETDASPGDSSCGVYVGAAGTNAIIRNSVCYNHFNGIFFHTTATGGEIDNCITTANDNAGVRTQSLGSGLLLKNHYSGGNTNRNYNEAGNLDITDWTCTTSMSSNTEVTEPGITNSIAWSTANFTNVTAGSIDVHLVTGSALINVATDLSASFTIDYLGATRPTGANTWDVGPHEFVAAGGRIFALAGNGGGLVGKSRGLAG